MAGGRLASAAGAHRWRALMADRRVARLAMVAMAAAIVGAASMTRGVPAMQMLCRCYADAMQSLCRVYR